MSTSDLLLPFPAPGDAPPSVHGGLSREQVDRLVPLLKALADPVRLRLMSLVAGSPGGESCVCDLTAPFELSQPTISHHLKVLHDAGLLERSKRGVWVYYRAPREILNALSALLGESPAGTPTTAGEVCR